MTCTPGRPLLLSLAASASCLLTLWFGWLSYGLYFEWLGKFNEEGRYFEATECVVYSTDSAILVAPALLFGALTVLLILAIRKRSKRQRLEHGGREVEETPQGGCS